MALIRSFSVNLCLALPPLTRSRCPVPSLWDLTASQVYTGPLGNEESNPPFFLSTFGGGVDVVGGTQASLTISAPVSAPEPSAFMMLFTGLVALFGALALKKATS